MKAWIYKDDLFCFGAIIVAKTRKEAIQLLLEHHITVGNYPYEVFKEVKLKDGFYFEAGGIG